MITFTKTSITLTCRKSASTEKITVTVPLVLAGEDARENDGGIVQQMLHELEIECLPTNLPEQIAADVSGLAIGDSLTVAEPAVDEGIEIKTSPRGDSGHCSCPD